MCNAGMHVGGAFRHIAHVFLEVRTEDAEGEEGRRRERRGQQALGFLTWAQ